MMNRERYCTSKLTAQTTIVFINSIYDVLKTQNWYFIKVSIDTIVLYDNMPASALNSVVTSAGDVLSQRKRPASIKPEATRDERIDLRISGQHDVLYAQGEKEENPFLFRAWRNKSWILQTNRRWLPIWSRIFHGKIQKTSKTILRRIKIQRFMLNKTANWNDMKSPRSRIVCSAQNA